MSSKLLSGALVFLLAILMIAMFAQVDLPVSEPDETSNEELGQQFFGDESDPGYSPVMLMLALLLIVGLLGSVFLAKEEERR